MPIIVNLDVQLARRKMTVAELAATIGITPVNVSVLKAGRAKAVRFSTLEAMVRAVSMSLRLADNLIELGPRSSTMMRSAVRLPMPGTAWKRAVSPAARAAVRSRGAPPDRTARATLGPTDCTPMSSRKRSRSSSVQKP